MGECTVDIWLRGVIGDEWKIMRETYWNIIMDQGRLSIARRARAGYVWALESAVCPIDAGALVQPVYSYAGSGRRVQNVCAAALPGLVRRGTCIWGYNKTRSRFLLQFQADIFAIFFLGVFGLLNPNLGSKLSIFENSRGSTNFLFRVLSLDRPSWFFFKLLSLTNYNLFFTITINNFCGWW